MTASTPPRIEVGLIQLVPRIAGHAARGHPTRRDGPGDRAQAEGHEHRRRRERGPEVALARRARRPPCGTRSSSPRNTIPSAAIDSGTNSVSVIDANASAKAVHSTTRQKISQTWFASHTGPIEWLITARGALPALGAAGGEVPEPGAEVGAAEQRVRGDPHHQDHARRRRSRHAAPSVPACSGVGRGTVRTAAPRLPLALTEPAAHHPQHQHEGDADADVDPAARRGT